MRRLTFWTLAGLLVFCLGGLLPAGAASSSAAQTRLIGGGAGGYGNAELAIRDTDGSHVLTISPGSNLTANRVFTLTTGDAARTMTLSGNPTLADWFDQSVKAAASPSFAGLTVAGAAISPALSGSTGTITPGALLAGVCAGGTATVTGATTAMAATATPVTYPGDGTVWLAYVSSADTVTVKVCAIVALTPVASVYRVRVQP